MRKFLTPIKVGALSTLAVVGFLFTIHSVQQGALGGSNTYRVYAVLDDVLGLAKRSRVVMAGIEVGYIESIELVGKRAKLNLRINNNVPLFADASLSKVSESLLGDKLITLDAGSLRDSPLGEGGRIPNVIEEADMTSVFSQLGDITRDIKAVTHSLKAMVDDMRGDDALGGMMERMNLIAANVASLTEQVNDTFLRSSHKIEQILTDVAGVTAGTRARYGEILDNVQAVSADIRVLVANLNAIVGQGETDWKESVSGVKETLEKANSSLSNLEEISRKINEGEGTIGRLVNDDKVLAKTESILDDASSFTSRLSRLRTEIDLHSEYLVYQQSIKNILSLKLVPKLDKYYMIQLIDDPRGAVEVVRTCTDAPCSNDEYTEKITVRDEFKFSVQFAKRFHFLGLRFGIIEDSGGLGADLFMFNDDLEFKFDLFQFGKNEYGENANPRLRAMAIYRPTWLANHVYLTAGADDFFNRESKNRHNTFDYFIGAGLQFDDEDLKTLFTTVGVPSF
jgi:phospholipid/cholesterol/gamma-HCH transport system substrate-binding protein